MSERIFFAGLGEGEPEGTPEEPRKYKRRTRRTCECLSHDPKWQWLRMDVCVMRSAEPYVGGGPQRSARALDPATVIGFLREHVPHAVTDVQENILVLPMNARGHVMGVARVHRGGRATYMVEIVSVLHPVIASPPATRFIVAHNHPTGNVSPSPEDDEVVRRLNAAADAVGVTMTDFLIIGPTEQNGYYSYMETGRMRR